MADKNTIELDEPHAPKPAALELYSEAETDLKKALLHSRHDSAKHGLSYWEAAEHLSDAEFVSFSGADIDVVRSGKLAYGNTILYKLRIPALAETKNSYIYFRLFEKNPSTPEKGLVHSIHTASAKETSDERARALFSKDEELEFFNT